MAFPSNSHRLDFLPIEDGGSLEIAYEGPPLDLQTLGVLHLNLQDIVDHVAFAVLRDEELIGPYGQRRRSSAPFRRAYDGRIVRAQPTKIEIGSLYEQIAFFVPAVLADPDVRSVLQNLAANIVWAIGSSRFARWSNRAESSPNQSPSPRYPRIEVGPNVRTIVMTLAENGGGTVKFRSRGPNGQSSEVVITANGH